MWNPGSVIRRRRIRVAVLMIAVFAFGVGCARSPGVLGATVAVQSSDAFIITERARLGAGVRADFERGVALLSQGETERGIALLVSVTEAAPDLTAAQIDLAIAYRQLGRLEESEAHLERALALSPRHPVALNEEFRQQIHGYMLRHKVKPGITGWAQVNGWRGETDTLEKMQKRVEYDLHYIRNWSLALDLKIIVLTICM